MTVPLTDHVRYPIETLPDEYKDGRPILCWASGWDTPTWLVWKVNPRIVRHLSQAQRRNLTPSEQHWCDTHDAAYFGEPDNWHDYHRAERGKGPTHWYNLKAPDGQ